MPPKPILKSYDDLIKNGLPCESYKLADLQKVAKSKNLNVKRTLKDQCKELETLAQPQNKASDFKETKVEKEEENDDEDDFFFSKPTVTMKKEINPLESQMNLRKVWLQWIEENMSIQFFQTHVKQIQIISDKQGRSNSILFEGQIVCPTTSGPYPFNYKDIIQHGWQNVALKIYRQYYYIDNGGTVEKQIYERIINNSSQVHECAHFLTLLGSLTLPLNVVVTDSKAQVMVRNKLGIVGQDSDIPLEVLILDKSNDSSTLQGILDREKNIDASPSKIKMFLGIILQILYALQTCAAYGIKHNDLHFRNILVEKLKHPITLSYDINRDDRKLIQFKTDYWVRVIDFDQASVYHPLIERNLRLDLNRFCSEHNICNYNLKNEHYDGYGFIYQLLNILKVKSKILTQWIRLFIDEESENYATKLYQTFSKQFNTQAQQKKPKTTNRKKIVGKGEKDLATLNWFHEERIHFGMQNIANNKLISWYESQNKHFPTINDLLHSILSYQFGHEVFTLIDSPQDPYALGHFYRLTYPRIVRFVQPTGSLSHILMFSKTSLAALPKVKSEKEIQKSISEAIEMLNSKLIDLNVFENESLLPIWKDEMELLNFNWQECCVELMQAYWYRRSHKFLEFNFVMACLLLTCPMFYGLPSDMVNELSENTTKHYISDVLASFNHQLPITMPSLNGL